MTFKNLLSLKSLRTRIALVVIGIGFCTTLSLLVYQQQALVRSTTDALEENSLNLVNTVALFVESHYWAIENQKNVMLQERKAMLSSVVDLAIVQVEIACRKYKNGLITEQQAKEEAKQVLKEIRYDNGVGYLWINSFEYPVPRMIMHPTMPELENQLLDSPTYNCALGKNENIFKAMVDVCKNDGFGYVDYFWPKPTESGMSDRVLKLSYVKLFEEWDWVIGTGLYADDIENDARKRLDEVIEQLKDTFSQLKVAQTGYMYLFTGKQEMLIHPYLVGADFSNLLNPATGHPMLVDLIDAAHTPSQKLIYIWDKPPEHTGDFNFDKIAFVKYFEPLDWYIASSIYSDEVEQIAQDVRNKVVVLGSGIILFGLVVSFWLSNSLARPLQKLSQSAKEISVEEDKYHAVPVSGTIETQELGKVLNTMLALLQGEISVRRKSESKLLASMKEEIAVRRETESTLKKALEEKEVLLREVHHRVKNNMAVVISMLKMQSRHVDDEIVKNALEESRSRISAMSLIHETLYRSDNLAKIPLKNYVAKIYKVLKQAMAQKSGNINFEMEGDEVSLTVEQAVPCGLFLNELMTNSFKYGYTKGNQGIISVEAYIENNDWIVLDYRDDGVGLPDDFDPEKQNTLGMRIVKLLVENQLNGNLRWENGKGAHFIVSWPVKHVKTE